MAEYRIPNQLDCKVGLTVWLDACDAAARKQKRGKTLSKSMLQNTFTGSNPVLTTMAHTTT